MPEIPEIRRDAGGPADAANPGPGPCPPPLPLLLLDCIRMQSRARRGALADAVRFSPERIAGVPPLSEISASLAFGPEIRRDIGYMRRMCSRAMALSLRV